MYTHLYDELRVALMVAGPMLTMMLFVWRSNATRMRGIELKLDEMRSTVVTEKRCGEAQGHYAKELRMLIEPIQKDINSLVSNGWLNTLQEKVENVMQRLAAIEERHKDIEHSYKKRKP